MSSELETTDLRTLRDRARAGDDEALNELLRRATGRLEALARSMLRRHRKVREREETGDVVQEATLSLIEALRSDLLITSTREFFGLAAEHIRRRLLDLGRHHRRLRRDHALLERPDLVPAREEEDLERWTALHEAVEALPAEARQTFCLRFYHGWQVREIAELMQVSPRQASRYWLQAALGLRQALGDRPLPEAE